MEQQSGESDDLQPQDLSSTCDHARMDLTRKGEECLQTNSIDAVRVVKPSGWYPGSGSSKGLAFPNTDPEDRLQPGDQIQPDNSFSNTTVTLSYVSRSHVFSTLDTLSQHSSVYGVPSISKFSTLDGYLQQVDRPLGLVPQSERLDAVCPAAPVMDESVAAVPLMQQTHEINGSRMATSGGVEKHKPQQRGNSLESTIFQDTDNNRGLQNGRSSNWPNSAICIDSSPELLTTDLEEDRRSADTEVLFLISRTEEPVMLQDSRSPRDLCSTSREYISPLQDPLSPSAISLDNADLLSLPQASRSLSAGNSFADKTADTRWDDLESRGPRLSGLSGAGTERETQSNSDNTPRSDISKDHSHPMHKTKAVAQPVVDFTEDEIIVPQVLEKKHREAATPNQNGKAKAEQRTFERKKLPPRSGRGTRLEAIVMNINPNWYKVSTKKPKASKPPIHPLTNSQTQTQSSTSEAAVSPNAQTASVGKNKVQNTAASSLEGEAKAASKDCSIDHINIHVDSGRESASESEHTSFFKCPDSSTSPKASSPSFLPDKALENGFVRGPSSEVDVVSLLLPSEMPEKSPGKQKAENASSKAAFPVAKTSKATSAPKKKRKKPRPCQSSMFSPQEPEIKLKYISYKEEKRDMRGETFSPFIHVERKPASTSLVSCTVINYPEEEQPRQKGQGQMQAVGSASGGFIPGAVPSTSCLQLGRISTHSKYHDSLVCCLCGGSANALDLGDLHGPYYPEGYRPSSKAPASTPGLKEEEEDFSDSDSSCSQRGLGRKYARPPGVPWPLKPGPRLNQEGLLGRWTSASTSSGSPPAKRARTQARVGVSSGAGTVLEDWYSPPVVPLEQCEYWLHEDCGVWATGVYLVKGRVYGLEEAVKVARETMCLRCHKTGATLGCFLKGCPNKYHYRCCLQSECVLNEENFSMKCTKHKNKSFKSLPGGRREDR